MLREVDGLVQTLDAMEHRLLLFGHAEQWHQLQLLAAVAAHCVLLDAAEVLF